METYFIENSIRKRSWIKVINGIIPGKHFNEVKPLLSLDYSALLEKYVHIFDEFNSTVVAA